MSKRVQLQNLHEKNGHLTEFAGFRLPLWFTGIIPEALAVRNTAGMFDTSHMGRTLIHGNDSRELLDKITTNNVASLAVGQGQYSLMCNQNGGIKDDVVVFRVQREDYLIVYNAGNRVKDHNWILENSQGSSVDVKDVSDDVAMIAVQGPRAREIVQTISDTDLSSIQRFGCSWAELSRKKTLVTRTGYTGEDGFEVFVWHSSLDESNNACTVWSDLVKAGKPFGIQLCGLGARDVLRLEAGLCLYGNEMDENTNPFEARLGFTVKLHKDFIGKEKLVQIKEKGTPKIRIGLKMENRVIPRQGFKIALNGRFIGTVTSGTLSPLLNTGIAMGYVEKEAALDGNSLDIQIRGRAEKAKVVKPPFYDANVYGYARKPQ